MSRIKTPTIPDWMIPSECRVRTLKGVSVLMNTTRSEKPVLYSVTDVTDGWDYTPFETATFRHWLDRNTVRTVSRWLDSIAG